MIPIETTSYFTAIRNELAHTTAQVVWHAQRANYAVVATMLPDYMPWYHLLVELDGEWLVSQSSYFNWLPYDDPSEQRGVFIDIQPVNEQVKKGRVSYRGQVVEAPVNEPYLCTVIWDVPAAPEDNLTYLELLSGERWQECVVAWYPATAPQLAEAYFKYYQQADKASQDKNWWAVDLLSTDDRQERLKLALVILDYADLGRDEYALGCLGAGPLEDLMSDWLLDQLEPRMANNLKLKYALSMVRMEFEAESLQHRLTTLLKP